MSRTQSRRASGGGVVFPASLGERMERTAVHWLECVYDIQRLEVQQQVPHVAGDSVYPRCSYRYPALLVISSAFHGSDHFSGQGNPTPTRET